jgi:hypothetical protein
MTMKRVAGIGAVVILTSVGTVVGGASAGGQVARPALASNRSAVIAGWVIFVGGPHRSELQRRNSGTVSVRTESGRLVATVHASKRNGFRVVLAPGRYKLSAIYERETPNGRQQTGGEKECPPTTVLARSGKTTRVTTAIGCDIP